MNKEALDPVAAQARINDIQQLYREWTQLVPRLETAQEDWQRGIAIMRELARFYFEGEYSRFHTAIKEEGLAVDLHTEGEYSVMSEDALWNAFHEQDALAWQRLRSAIAVLDRYGEKASA